MKYTEEFEERFWSKVDAEADIDECWHWLAGVGIGGYGKVKCDGRTRHAHRVAYELTHGEIPEHDSYHGWCVCHRCDNRLCVNPRHLFLGLQADNSADRDAKGRTATGERNGRTKVTDEEVAMIRELAKQGKPHRDIAAQFGTSRSNVTNIVNYRHRKAA